MSEIERIQRYIERTGIDARTAHNYALYTRELDVFLKELKRDWFTAIGMIYNYGLAKGYRAAKAQVRHE